MGDNSYTRFFGNVVAYAKGWYKRRSDAIWMDMIHVINADGWMLSRKHEVATWCLHRLDELRNEEKFPYKHQLNLAYFFGEVNEHIRRAKMFYDKEIDQDDAIIYAFLSIIMEINSDWFTDGVKPSNDILPVKLQEAWYSEREQKLYPAEMMCDYQMKVENLLNEYQTQPKNSFNDFSIIEEDIMNKSFKDVLVLPGSDNLNDCTEIILDGKSIINRHLDGNTVELGIYEHCIDIDPNKKYKVRYSTKIEIFHTFTDITHTIRSIREV